MEMIDASVKRFHCPKCNRDILAPYLITKCPDCGFDLLDVRYIITEDEKSGEYTVRIKRADRGDEMDREKVIKDLNTAKLILCNPQMLTPEMCVIIGQAITSAISMLKEQEVRELTIDEWREWKANPKRNPICKLWENDTSPMWILNPNDVHEPALLMGKLKLFTGKPTFEQCKEVKWK